MDYIRIIKIAIFMIVALLTPMSPGSFFTRLAYAQETTNVSVSAPIQVNSGEQFTIDVLVDPGTAIAGAQFDLAFDPLLVTVDSVAEGNLLSQDGAATYFKAGTIDNASGNITGVAAVIITPGQAVSTQGTLATITLTAGTGGGTCLLNLSSIVVADIDGQSIPVSVDNGQVNINQLPVLESIGNKSVNEGELLTFPISATDPDGGSLTYSASNLPSGANFDPDTQTFSWTPNYSQAGVYPNIHFEVSDGSLADSADIIITVNQPYEDWDTNGDGVVNVLDMTLVGQHWDETGLIGWIQEDVNEDGMINVLDMILIGQHWTG